MLSCYLKLKKNKTKQNTRRARELEVVLAVWAALKFLHCYPLCEGGCAWERVDPTTGGILALVLGPLADRPQGTDR